MAGKDEAAAAEEDAAAEDDEAHAAAAAGAESLMAAALAASDSLHSMARWNLSHTHKSQPSEHLSSRPLSAQTQTFTDSSSGNSDDGTA